MKKTAWMLLADGFEEAEALVPADYLRRVGVELRLLSATGRLAVSGGHGITVFADALLAEFSDAEADALILPGGGRASEFLANQEAVLELLRRFSEQKRLVAAICAAPTVLEKAGLLEGKRGTSYPSVATGLSYQEWLDRPVVRDGRLITGQGPASAALFAFEIINDLMPAELPKLREATLQDRLERHYYEK